jgi:hypothetical protein
VVPLGAFVPRVSPAAGAVRATVQSIQGATFEYTAPAARFDTVTVDGIGYARVSVAGAPSGDAPGKPGLPIATIQVGVPDGMSPRLRVLSAEWDERPGLPPLPVVRETFLGDDPRGLPMSQYHTEPDPAIYRGTTIYPHDEATLGRGVAVGEMWAVPILIRPVRYDPSLGSYRVLRTMTLRVDFVAATASEMAARPEFRPGSESEAWRRVQRGLVGNYESARAFPIRAGALPPRSLAPRAPRGVNPEFRLSITATGWTSVDYAALSGAGFPAGIPIDQVAVFIRGWNDPGDSAVSIPLPVVAKDVGTPGVFDAGDAITFYALSLRDRAGAGSIENRYATSNVYWLTWTGSPAVRPDSIPGDPGAPGERIPANFGRTVRLEQDQQLLTSPNQYVSAPPENVDYLFWTNGSADPYTNREEFDTPIAFDDPDVTQPFRIVARYQGQANQPHRLSIFYQDSTGVRVTLALDATFFNQDLYVLDTGFSLPGTLIHASGNHYQHVGQRQVGGGWVPGSSRAWLDWIETTYRRLYRARGNSLQFTSDGAGDVVELRVGGFTSSNIVVYDVTNPLAPQRVTGVRIAPAGGGTFELTFQSDAVAAEHRFVAFVPGTETVIGPGAVVEDTPSTLSVPGPYSSTSVARAILITPRAFLTAANRLADYRRGQGYVVEVAEVQDIYDEFNGGVKSPRAIRRYLRHAYLTWTPRPTFVILAGDASLDYRHLLAESSADWVPTYMKFETIAGPQGAELVAHDSHYSLNLNAIVPGENDFVPSVFLSRIPASAESELDHYVTKVIQYEDFRDNDTWRGRMLLLSDDEYSSTIYFTAGYCLQPVEALFRQTSGDLAGGAAASASGQDLVSQFFDLKTYSDPLAASCVNPIDSACRLPYCIVNGFRVTDGAVDRFQDALAQGALILNVQSHANRYLIAHEMIFCSGSPMVPCPSFSDMDLIGNTNRPVYLMVWGCHANQFPDGPVGGGSIDSTDAFGEQWVLQPSRAAIASLGSTAYEFLNTNSIYNLYVGDAFYKTPPAAPSSPGQPRTARWILGEVMGAAAITNAVSPFAFQAVMNRTIMLLGDPMLRMDALPPRIFEATLDGNVVPDGSPLGSDSPTDSLTLVAKVRDEAGIRSTSLAERDLATGAITPLDSTLYTVAVSDTGRQQVLTGRIRPRIGNYDLQVRAVDGNGRLQVFALQVRTPIRYYADGIEIVNGVFVENAAVLRAEITTPIPVTADSLELWLDGAPIVATKTRTDTAGRAWRLESLAEARGPGGHTLQVAVGGRTAGLDQATYSVSTDFTMRGVVAVSPNMRGAGCDGAVLQFELSGQASRVELLVMTVSGRRVASLSIPGMAGLNVYCWDGRDSQGNHTATGLYLYRLTATGGGRSLSQSGKMIRSR